MISKKTVALICVAALLGSAFGFLMIENKDMITVKEEKKYGDKVPDADQTEIVEVKPDSDFSFTVDIGFEIEYASTYSYTDRRYFDVSFSGNDVTISGTYTSTTPNRTFFAIAGVDLGVSAILEILFVEVEDKITVTYNANGGSCSTSSVEVKSGSSVTLPSASKSGYVFNGWYTASSGGTFVGAAGGSYKPAENITLYAQFSLSVKFTSTVSDPYCVQGSSFTYNVTTNPTNTTLSVSGPGWVKVSGHKIYGTPTSSDVGSNKITITATYGGVSATQSFTLTVAKVLDFTTVPTGGILVYPNGAIW